MLRILQVVTDMNRGGLESMLMNYYRHMDREKIQFDFLTHRPYEGDYGAEIKAMNGVIYHLPRLNPFSPDYRNTLRRFFGDHPQYGIIHVHQDCMSSLILKIAEEEGVTVRIAHSHNADQDRNIKYPIKLYWRKRIPVYATHMLSCSRAAGDWMFDGSEYEVVANAIEVKKYAYDCGKRTRIRDELGIDEKDLVMGHVGAFRRQKNHDFLIDIFADVSQRVPSKMMLVGDGPLREEIRKKTEKYGLSDRIIFTGIREDVEDLMQAMDVFVFPSLYEGFPLAVIEAQAAGLPCLLSDVISDECIITENVKRMSIEDTPQKWADAILKTDPDERRDQAGEIRAASFDIVKEAKELQEFYLSLAVDYDE